MNRLFRTLLLFCCALTAFPDALWAAPQGPPPQGPWRRDRGITIGAGAAYLKEPVIGHAFAPSLDLTFFKRIRSPFSFWTSIVGKLPIGADGPAGFVPGLEAGLNVIPFNFGAGYGIGIGDALSTHQVNLFLGMGIPLRPKRKNRMVYAQAYYRPILLIDDGNTGIAHEVGMLFKWMAILEARKRPRQ